MKKIISMLLVLLLLSTVCFSSFAVAPASTFSNEQVATNSSFGGYAHRVASTSSGTFNVNVSGSGGLAAGLTFKTECSNSNAFAVISIQRPNGGYILNKVTFSANQEKKYTFALPKSGTYTVTYSTYTSDSTIHMQCWIYG